MNGESPTAPRALIVEDEETLRELIIVTLGEAFACEEGSNTTERKQEGNLFSRIAALLAGEGLA